MKQILKTRTKEGFSLVEVLMTLAIISIMAALVINNFSNAAQDSRNVMARQHQAVIQSALNNWVAGQISNSRSIASVRTEYNFSDFTATTPSTDRTPTERLALIGDYLDQDTADFFTAATVGGTAALRSAAMEKTNQYLVLSEWAEPDFSTGGNRNPYPKAELFSN